MYAVRVSVTPSRPCDAWTLLPVLVPARDSCKATRWTVCRHAKTHHSFLDANSQAHQDPFYAFADIVDNSREAHSTRCAIGVRNELTTGCSKY